MKSVSTIRWIVLALTAALAIALVLRGNVVIGVLLGALAVMRAVMFTKMNRRREEFRRRIEQRRGAGTGFGPRAR